MEGSTVLPEGKSFPPNQKLLWRQIEGLDVKLEYGNKENAIENLNNPSFTAP